MMSVFNRKLLRLCSVIGLYICLLSGSIYILQNNTTAGKISLDKIISNEAKTINHLKLIYKAQKEYCAVDWDKDGIKNYAEFVVHLWQTVDQKASPVRNNFIPKKLAFAMGASRALHGYYFQSVRFKEIQSSNPDSRRNNRHQSVQSIDIDLTNEWAISAIPAEYGRTGTLSFIIGSSGKIYAKDMKNRPVESIPENFIAAGWNEITNEMDIRQLHT